MSRRYIAVALLALGLACSSSRFPGGCSNSSGCFSPTGLQIQATKSLTFDPVTTMINKGETVVWFNSSGINHNITFENGPAFSRDLSTGDPLHPISLGRKFTTPGTFNYFCAIHGKSMHGTVVVIAPLRTP